ncbi:MAG: trehalose-phosphatase [Actinomycetota bacterium]|nr:trehalose-phosphatase [Actinomycetota bacterium]
MTELEHPEAALSALADDASRRPLLLALDFDGTLAPIVDHPLDARALPESMSAVERLATVPGLHLALVSGRGLEELSTVTGPVPESTWLVGAHGAERGRIHDGVFVLEPFELDAQARALQDDVVAGAEQIGARHEGVLVQRKPTTVLVHTKMATPEVEDLATRDAVALGSEHHLKTVVGKHIVEIAVHPAHKGDGIVALRAATGARSVVYVGDDTTDEDAFAVLGAGDVGIKVGPGPTRAAYRVSTPEDVATLLGRFADQL